MAHPAQVRSSLTWTNPSAPPGKSQKYAKPERERRFLLGNLPAGEIVKTAIITDIYFVGTRLRLRMMEETERDATHKYYKLTQKIPAPDCGPGLLATTYLNEEEFSLLASIQGCELRKTRYSIPPFGIDVFAPPLTGLILGECEFDDDAAMHAFMPPAWILADVTFDVRFTGASLATMDPGHLPKLLSPFGVMSEVAQ